MDTKITPGETRSIITCALWTHARQLRLEAQRRGNAGPQNKDHRDALRAEARKATALAAIVSQAHVQDLGILQYAQSA
jgi:hypothetical protein